MRERLHVAGRARVVKWKVLSARFRAKERDLAIRDRAWRKNCAGARTCAKSEVARPGIGDYHGSTSQPRRSTPWATDPLREVEVRDLAVYERMIGAELMQALA